MSKHRDYQPAALPTLVVEGAQLPDDRDGDPLRHRYGVQQCLGYDDRQLVRLPGQAQHRQGEPVEGAAVVDVGQGGDIRRLPAQMDAVVIQFHILNTSFVEMSHPMPGKAETYHFSNGKNCVIISAKECDPMRYKGKVYRPPSEAYSLIVQVTYGCSHNRCAFCDMYDDKHFSMRPMAEIREDFELARRVYRRVERVFLADGDALMRRTEELVEILGLVYGLFPECQRVTCYASPTSLQVKSEDELRLLRARGLKMVYMGLESGCDAVLTRMQKGHDAAAIVAAGQKARRCGLTLSVTAISGLGSVEMWQQHAADTAKAVSEIKPDYLGLLTLMVEPGTPLESWVKDGSFTLLSPPEVLKETELFLRNVDSEGTVFRANHASNYLTLKGILNGDRDALLGQIAAALAGRRDLKPEFLRAL